MLIKKKTSLQSGFLQFSKAQQKGKNVAKGNSSDQ